jgi:dynein light intermediate chain 1
VACVKFLGVKKWQDYVEPGDELEQGSPMRRTSRNLDEEGGGDVLPLGDGVLTRNLGLDVVVVVTKVKGLCLK